MVSISSVLLLLLLLFLNLGVYYHCGWSIVASILNVDSIGHTLDDYVVASVVVVVCPYFQ